MKRLITALTLTATLATTATHVEATPAEPAEAPAVAQQCQSQYNSRAAAAVCWAGDSNDAVRVRATVRNDCTGGTIYGWGNVVHVRNTSTYSESSSCLRVIGATYIRYDCYWSPCYTSGLRRTARTPQHADGCRSWTTSGYTAAAYCTHLDKGWWMYLQIVCKQKFSTNTYVAYTTRTYLPWTTKQKSCASGYYLASHRTITGNY